MNNYNFLKPIGYEEAQVRQNRPHLNVGGYVCKIVKVILKMTRTNLPMLELYFDIAEGDNKGFFQNDYNLQTDDKKWRGVYRMFLPNPEDYEKNKDRYNANVGRYKTLITCIEKSNKGFTYNFQEASLVNKLVGVIFGLEEWEYMGKQGYSVKPRFIRSVDTIRSGDFKVPKPKNLKNSSYSEDEEKEDDNSQNTKLPWETEEKEDKTAFEVTDDDLPF